MPKESPQKLPEFLGKKPGVGKITGKLDELKPAERRFVEELRDLGQHVEIVPRGAGKTPDFLINGVSHELKTVTNIAKTDSDGISKAISSTIMDARSQSPRIIIDARMQNGMTKEIAERCIERALGRDAQTGSKIESITILTVEAPLHFLRSKKLWRLKRMKTSWRTA